MTTLQLTHEKMECIYYEDDPEFALVENTTWTQNGKYQHSDVIVQHVPTEKFYRFRAMRSGSPFTDWFYIFDTKLVEVEKRKEIVVIEKWEPIP